jgi:murein DD-endopeptidase MepM/ murein hydrolase activator NlpD
MKKIFLLCLLSAFALSTSAWAEIQFTPYPNPVPQGKCQVIQVINDSGYIKNVEANVDLPLVNSDEPDEDQTYPIPFYAWGFKWRGIVPIPLTAKPDTYTMNLKVTDGNNQVTEHSITIQVIAGKFKTVSFNLPAKKHAILKSGKVNDEWPEIEQLLKTETPDQLYTSRFKLPIKGWLSMPFGVREIVNGKKRSQHTGNDFGSAAVYKALIRASNSGKVVIARPFEVFGNTVVIDHGQGIYSLYYHLSKIAVTEGQDIIQGQILGNMGTTGISTSPHLHYGFSVHNVRVDGLQWINDPLFRKAVQ